MRKILVVFASETSAAQIKKYLFEEHKIISKILPTPENIAVSGCGFSLSADFADIDVIRDVYKRQIIPSTPRLVFPAFSVTISPVVPKRSGVPAFTDAKRKFKNVFISVFFLLSYHNFILNEKVKTEDYKQYNSL